MTRQVDDGSERIVRYVGSLGDGTYIVEHSDGQLERKTSQTDWARVDATTETEIEAAIAGDPDWAGTEDVDWSKAELVVLGPKKPISIRLDQDVLEFFKREGSGYQRRINAVLRTYMEQVSKKRA